MLHDNLAERRRALDLTQEQLAEQVGVSRQTISEWECGETVPDLPHAIELAKALGVKLDDLVSYNSQDNNGMPIPPEGKHIFGVVTVGAKGQVVIPKPARDLFGLAQGDTLLVLGDESHGLALLKADVYLEGVNALSKFVEAAMRTPEE